MRRSRDQSLRTSRRASSGVRQALRSPGTIMEPLKAFAGAPWIAISRRTWSYVIEASRFTRTWY